MDRIFYDCVHLLQQGAACLGITYQQLNVVLFVFLHPAVTLVLAYRLWRRPRAAKSPA